MVEFGHSCRLNPSVRVRMLGLLGAALPVDPLEPTSAATSCLLITPAIPCR